MRPIPCSKEQHVLVITNRSMIFLTSKCGIPVARPRSTKCVFAVPCFAFQGEACAGASLPGHRAGRSAARPTPRHPNSQCGLVPPRILLVMVMPLPIRSNPAGMGGPARFPTKCMSGPVGRNRECKDTRAVRGEIVIYRTCSHCAQKSFLGRRDASQALSHLFRATRGRPY